METSSSHASTACAWGQRPDLLANLVQGDLAERRRHGASRYYAPGGVLRRCHRAFRLNHSGSPVKPKGKLQEQGWEPDLASDLNQPAVIDRFKKGAEVNK